MEKILESRMREILKENGDYVRNGTGFNLLLRVQRDPIINIDIVFRFADMYGVSIDYLLGRSDFYGYF